MGYPEPGAGYKHTPKWLDDMKRAEGGSTDDKVRQHTLNATFGSLLPPGVTPHGEDDDMPETQQTHEAIYPKNDLDEYNKPTGD